MRIAIGAMMHESNTFSPIPTTLESFEATKCLTGEDILAKHRGENNELGGVLKVLEEENATVCPTLSAWAMPSGVVTAETYEHLKGDMLRRIGDLRDSLDGVLLSLHGSMTVEDLEDPEADLLGTIRRDFPQIKYLGTTLDHHGNISKEMVSYGDFFVGYRTHPHIDQFDVGSLAARHMVELIKDAPTLTKSFVKLPQITATENRTRPVDEMHMEIKRIQQDPAVFSCSYFVGYAWADVGVIGASVLAITRDDQALADKYADQLACGMWDRRKDFQFPLSTADQAVRDGLKEGKYPVVLDELCDCTMGGASGDIVVTARALIDQQARNSLVTGIVDPQAVAEAQAAGVGQTVKLSIGGKICTKDNPPLSIEGVVKIICDSAVGNSGILTGYESDLGKIAVVDVNGVEILLIENPGMLGGPGFLVNLGIDPRKKDFIVVKEGMNPVLEYKDIAARLVMLDTPGFNKQTLRAEDYKKIPRPIYPIDRDMSWKPGP
jgi:microcystin degradation protein MlrC